MRNDIYLKVRVGLPQRGGALVAAARERGLPALVSANAFVRYDKDRRFRGFALPHARPAQRRHRNEPAGVSLQLQASDPVARHAENDASDAAAERLRALVPLLHVDERLL